MASAAELRQEQRAAISFCVRLGKTGAETLHLLKQAYGEEALGDSTVFRWHQQFKDGRESSALVPHVGRPVSTCDERQVNTVSAIIQEDPCLTVRDIEDFTLIPKSSVHRILTQHLQLRRVSARWVPHLLTTEQMKKRVEICRQWKEMVNADNRLMERVITGDETWVYHHDPLCKQQSSAWKHPGSPPPKKVRQTKSAKKFMMIFFFDCRGVVYQHAVPPQTSINAEYYVQVLKKLKKHVQQKRPEIGATWVLHHDNARPHTGHVTTSFLQNQNIQLLAQPPYSPDLAPCDFWLFYEMKKALKGKRFQTSQEAQTACQGFINHLPEEEFQKTFRKWMERWDLCISKGGRYFEKE
jgi:[histone H3]-lysine36 N-dimethyltransferase SETMAR